MSRKLDNATLKEYINKFTSYNGAVTVKEFCIENELSKTQFYYHKKRLEKTDSTTAFYAILLNAKQDNMEQKNSISKEVKINIDKDNIAITVSKTSLIASIIEELATEC